MVPKIRSDSTWVDYFEIASGSLVVNGACRSKNRAGGRIAAHCKYLNLTCKDARMQASQSVLKHIVGHRNIRQMSESDTTRRPQCLFSAARV
jgi:hypothetical protein